MPRGDAWTLRYHSSKKDRATTSAYRTSSLQLTARSGIPRARVKRIGAA